MKNLTRENVGAAQFYHRCGFNHAEITAVFPARPDAVEKEMESGFSSNGAEPVT